MLKLKKITIENFRGLKFPLVIDFIKGNRATSALIYGRNGTGKSSIVDAWEWLLNFNIENLRREGVVFTDFPHKASNGNNSYISVDFQHTSINNATAKFNIKKISSPTISGEYGEFKALSKYPNYLRYTDLNEFICNKRKAERYEYIAKFFGLEKFSLLQDTLQATINKQTVNLQNIQSTFKASTNSVNVITGLTTVDEAIVVNFINSIGAKHKIPTINTFKDSEKVKSALQKIVQTNPIARELSEWKSFQTKQNQFYPITTAKLNCTVLEQLFNDLKQNEESIKQLILSSLYELSIEILPKLEDKSKCPVCDETFDGDLLKHITEKHNSLAALNKNKTDFDTKKSALEKQFEGLARKVAALESESSSVVLSTFQSFFDNLRIISSALPELTTTLKKPLKDLASLSLSDDPTIEKIDAIISNEVADRKIVADKIIALSKDETTRTLAQDYTNLSNIIENFKGYSINKEKVTYLEDINDKLQAFLACLTTYIQTIIKTTFESISADVVDYFNVLENSNPDIKNPSLKLLTGKDKAVELEIEFASEKVTPAFKFLSESQVNSFGLAIFLAAVKHFNSDFKFFILDDVVNSFDSFKRPKVSQLIASRFSDFQVLMITHDQIFFDTVQKQFPEWQRYKFTSWSYTTGPKYKLSKNYTEEIQEYLDEDKPITAGQTLGRYLEWIFGALNENMQTPISYKVENVYTLSEFYNPLVKRFRDKLKIANKQHKLIVLFDEFESSTIFRNYCAHWKNEANQFTTDEIDGIFKKWNGIEQMIFCTSCKSLVFFEKADTAEYIRCTCGTINLKEQSHYLTTV
jgi:DNA repair exonuclease SbcCD ATPase subunit